MTTSLKNRLVTASTEAKAKNEDARIRAEVEQAKALEVAVEGTALAFKRERLKYLEELLEGAAAKGDFEHVAWRYTPLSSRFPESLITNEGTIRGMRYIKEWIEEQGLRSDLTHRDEIIPDYGHVEEWVLTASWGE